MASPSSVVTLGFGTPGSAALVVTLGFGSGEAVDVVQGPYWVKAQQGFAPGMRLGDAYIPGQQRGQANVPGSGKGQSA